MNNKLATETCVDYKINSRAEQMSTDLKTKTWFFRNGTAIANNTNLNSLTTCGTYNEDSSTNATTLVNCPTKYAFSMNVFDTTGHANSSGWAYRIQEVTDIFGNAWRRWGETAGTSTWTWNRWVAISGSDGKQYSYGSNGTLVDVRRSGSVVTVYVQINTLDTGTMSSWQTRDLCTLDEQFRMAWRGWINFPVLHDSSMNSGGSIIINGGGTVQFSTRGGAITGTGSSVWVYASCTYVII